MNEILKVGDKVKSEFYFTNKDVIRTITSVTKSDIAGSGYMASADAGEPCKCCGRPFANPVINVDMAWFNKVE